MTNPRRDSTRQIVATDGADAALFAQVPGDGLGAGVVAGFGELFAQRDDRVLDVLADAVGVAAGAARPRLERGLALGLVAGDEGLHPAPRDAVVASDLALGPALEHHRCDHDPGHRHRPPPPPSGCKRCRETPANYVVNSDTLSSTMS